MFVRRVAPRSLQSFTRSYASAKKVTLTVEPYKAHKCQAPPNEVTTTKEELISSYSTMFTIRRMEQEADKLYKARKIQGFLHLYNGQEAIVAGIENGITPKDHVITAYRDHGFAFTRGASVQSILAELLGKAAGVSQGKGGSMHMYSKEGNFYGGNGIVGAQCPVGAGLAFTQKYNNTGNVSVTCYGDGSANQGQLFEAYNMASLWKLPVIFVCENNKYGMGTSVNRASANDQFYTRGDFVPGLQVDGMDYLAVRNAVQFSHEFVNKNGPIILEMVTYRYVGHSMSDPGTTYRTREEIDEYRKTRDPIDRVRNLLIEKNLATDEELRAIEKDIRASITKDVESLDSLPFPEVKETYTDVYDKPTYIRGVELSKSYHP